MTKTSPQEIMRRAYIEAEDNGEPLIYRIAAQTKALDAAGYMIEKKVGSLEEIDEKISLYERRLESLKAVKYAMTT